MANHQDRYPDNVPGPYYVDDQCIDCDLCRERMPDIFVRNDDGGHSYVRRQPVNEDEIAICEEARDSCPTEAIGNDGTVAGKVVGGTACMNIEIIATSRSSGLGTSP